MSNAKTKGDWRLLEQLQSKHGYRLTSHEVKGGRQYTMHVAGIGTAKAKFTAMRLVTFAVPVDSELVKAIEKSEKAPRKAKTKRSRK